ncbi:MAG: type I restriction endonuclease subunit R [Nitrospira sp.]|nr:type I restriction endonuclease subunit R [Nitrospira sp.]
MPINIYTESDLIEQPAIELFKSLGFSHQDCYNETFGETGTLGRETSSDVVLKPKLKKALINLNPSLPSDAIEQAIEELTSDRSILHPVTANREIYKLIRDGVKVKVRQKDGTEADETVRVIDFNEPDSNDFFLASQFWITGEMYKRRADLVGFVNGLPLIFIELKAVHKKLENAFRNNLTDYKDTIPQIFWYNAFIILSNGSESRIGTISADFEHFSEWKKINSEGEEGVVSLETIIKGTCEKSKFLDLLENFILYKDAGGSLTKIIAKNHQYLGVNNTIDSFRKMKENQGRLGVFWHTQGSGKSFSMIFFSQKVLRKFEGNYTFIIVTDRKELDEQIYKNFAEVGAITEQEVHAESGKHLEQLLKEDHRNIFTLIHKFGDIDYMVSNRSDIIVITDESHRTQYDTLAMNMRTALPNAAFIAFTGTPLIVGEELTRKTFGDYVSVYNFKQSIDDNATVPLYYENRIPEVQLKESEMKEGIEQILEEAMLSPEQEEKLQQEFSREYHIITRDDRLEKIAEDIVKHFLNRGYQGKAMVVSIDKPTAVKMYDKVQKYWTATINDLKKQFKKAKENKDEIQKKIDCMKETDMAVVVSQEQNEIEKFKKLGLKIEKHRRRMGKEDLATKFKDPNNSFRIVFVCAMWMTGFDVPCLSTMYLDKPMKNHALMQTIARANRVFRDKVNGLLVDYCGIFRNLQKALAIYGTDKGGATDSPVKPKAELIRELEDAIVEIEKVCDENNADIRKIADSDRLMQIKYIGDATDALLVNDDTKRRYLALALQVDKLFKAILPDPDAKKYADICTVVRVIAERIRSIIEVDVDIADIKKKIEDLLNETVEVIGHEDYHGTMYGKKKIDLSKIDFEALKKKFDKGRKRNTQVAMLEAVIRGKLERLVRLNKMRAEILERFQKMIAEYNAGSMNIEKLFEELLEFVKRLDEEEQRSIKEYLSEEELALFDILKKPKLTNKETEQVKLASKKLLRVLKSEKLILDWRKKQQARAEVLFTIETILDKMLPESYTPEIYRQKCDTTYQHVYDSYYGDNKSVYI